MAYWLLKSEPNDYSFADLERDGGTEWDGVKNNLALKHMRAVRTGDQALIYHTGKEKAVVGIAAITSDPYPDPALEDERLLVFDIEPKRRLKSPVPLAAIKADTAFEEWELVRMPRLSVMPVAPRLWKRILEMGKL